MHTLHFYFILLADEQFALNRCFYIILKLKEFIVNTKTC